MRGPNLFFAGLVDGPGSQGFGEFSAATPDEGRAVVQALSPDGVRDDQDLSRPRARRDRGDLHEAHKKGMTCTGHVPTSMDLHSAIDSGMDQLAHFPVRGDLTTEEGKQQIAHFLAKKTVFDPTASWGEIGGKSARSRWRTSSRCSSTFPRQCFRTASHRSANHRRIPRLRTRVSRGQLANIKAAHDAGVPIITGTDEGIPAYSVYREMELYVKAGFTPMDALRAATAVAAQAMRVDKDVGTIETGKRADLLVLDANPLENISNVRSVRFVMKGGKMFESAALWTAAGFKP